LSANEEELRHLKIKLEILEQGRALINASGSENEKINLLLQECKTLQSRLEEAHEMLYDVKSNWSSQNLSLETQVQRLSRQVAEETCEKRKSIEEKELLQQKIKKLEFDMIKIKDELKQRDNKVS
jgi:golgin subfamily A protein 1